jgi:alpha-L-rhamnosidase
MLAKWAALCVLVIPLPAQETSIPGAPSGLRCEYLTDPVGIDVPQPRFSWVLEHRARGESQSAFQLLVSLKPDAVAGDQWDTGKVLSGQSVHVAYTGKHLVSGQAYYWKVRYWDSSNHPGPYSAAAHFETGLFESADWKGHWINGANQFRREFNLPTRPVRARAYVAGVGYYELRVNGHKVGDHVLDPAWTTYDQRVLYTVYDITERLRPGANAVGVSLGEGWFKARALRMQIHAELEGGQSVDVATDGTWKTMAGPIQQDSVYNGEVYDARLETPGWDRAGFDDALWKAASLIEGPKGVLSAQMMPPIRVVDTIAPVKMTTPRAGVYIYDLGQNISGVVEMRVRGPRGVRVQLRHAELLYEDGTLNVENLRAAKATDAYFLRGDGSLEVYQPRFTYHGFRYVELTGYPGAPKFDTLRAKVIHSDVRPIGGFTSSKQILNQIQRNIVWGIQDNLHSVPTDCNQRDERQGWMADAHLYAETAMLNFDMAAFYTNFLRDIHDVQGTDGTLTDTVPHRFGSRPADPAWGMAYPLLTWYMYEYYGDRRILEQHFDGVKAWTDYLRSRSRDGILDYSYYGDWVPIEKTPGNLVSTYCYYWSADLVSRMAEILGKSVEAESYRKLAGEVKNAFNAKFLNAASGVYGTGTQTAQVLPLFLDMVPDNRRGGVMGALRDDLVYTRNTHLTTGILGTKYLFPLLTRTGNSDLAYELATQTTYPSWGYMVENGATTLWELWQNKTGPSMNSHNHPMFGSLGAWFYNALAGINPDAAKPGFENVLIAPQVVRDLKWAEGSLDTIRGTVASSWSRTDDGLRLTVTIPVGSQAEVKIPELGLLPVALTESGRAIWKAGKYEGGPVGVTGVQEKEGSLVVHIGSGIYTFALSRAALRE